MSAIFGDGAFADEIEFWIVDNLWAVAIVVRPFAAVSSAAWTNFSDWGSRADEASFKSDALGFRNKARAIATRSREYRLECSHLTVPSYKVGSRDTKAMFSVFSGVQFRALRIINFKFS